MTAASLAAFRRTVTVEWPKARDADARALLLRTAREGHARIMRDALARSGSAPTFEAYANAPGRAIDSVVLPGPIVFNYRYVGEVVKTGLDLLRRASPVQSGAYRDSHTVLVNGVQVAAVPPRLSDRDEVVLVNPVPYARRIEIGRTEAGRTFVLQVPNRIYERTAKALATRYRNVASIRFGYLALTGAFVTKGRLRASYGIGGGRRRRRRQRAGTAVQAPAIFIRALGAGKAA